ncbi:MAG: hypothetical protein NXI24_09290 [bacterium]|nr:hypothetical protein [bacterium]
MNENPDPTVILPWIFVLFPLAFGLLWASVLTLTSRLGGWHRLAQSYPDEHVPEKYSEFMSSGRMGWMNYNGVLKMHAGPRGLHIAVILPFRPGHPPICIPWHALKVFEDSSMWIRLARLEIQHQGREIAKLLIREAAAERLRLKDRAGS